MKMQPKLSLALAGLVVLGAALVSAQTNPPAGVTNGAGGAASAPPALAASGAWSNPPASRPPKRPLPRLLDLGAGKCIPCRMMFPVLDGLKLECAGQLEVEFIDVWKNPDAGQAYRIEVIPTQIFFDASGKELFRHVGFYPKADILAKWKELGVDLKK